MRFLMQHKQIDNNSLNQSKVSFLNYYARIPSPYTPPIKYPRYPGIEKLKCSIEHRIKRVKHVSFLE